MNVRQKLQRFREEIAARWLLLLIILVHKSFPKGHDKQEMYVEESCPHDLRLRVRIEIVKLRHERFFIEEMEYLGAVKLDRVDQEQCMIQTWKNRSVRTRGIPQSIPWQVVCSAVEQKRVRRDGTLVDEFMGQIKDASGEGPV